MGLILYLSLLPLFSISYFTDKKRCKKSANIFAIYLLLFVIILCAGSFSNNDTYIYLHIFFIPSLTSFQSKDVGYGVLLWLSHQFGWSYLELRFAEYAMAFLILHFVVKKICREYEPIFWILYFIYPLVYDNIEVRNFLAEIIFYLAIYFISKPQKRQKWWGIIFYVLACLFHKIIVIYLPIFLFYILKKRHKLSRIRLANLSIVFVLLLLLGTRKSILTNLLSLLPASFKSIPGIGRNLETTNNNGWIVTYAELIMAYLTLIFNITMLRKAVKRKAINRTSFIFCKISISLGLYSLLFTPFYALSGDYERVLRDIIPLIYCSGLALVHCVSPNIEIKKLKDFAFLCVIMGIVPILSIYYSGQQYILIYDTFINNWIWNFGSTSIYYLGQNRDIVNEFGERSHILC